MDPQSQPEVYDLLILGSGAGSKLLAWTFAGQGQRVAVVERKYVGGACPNAPIDLHIKPRWEHVRLADVTAMAVKQ